MLNKALMLTAGASSTGKLYTGTLSHYEFSRDTIYVYRGGEQIYSIPNSTGSLPVELAVGDKITHKTAYYLDFIPGVSRGISVKEVEEYQTFEVTSLEDGFVGYFEIVK